VTSLVNDAAKVNALEVRIKNSGTNGKKTLTDRLYVVVDFYTGPLNTAPNANAGLDQSVGEGVLVAISGSASDPDGDPLTYSWTQTAGPAVTLSGAATLAPTFVSPTVTATTVLTFRLEVNDDKGGSSADSVDVTVLNDFNEPPSGSAGADQVVKEGATVSLNGNGSSDPNGDPLTYSWAQTSGPAVTLSSPLAASPTFTAPQVSVDTALTFELVVNDGNGGSDSDVVSVTVINNNPPVANAGADQVVNEQAPVTLNGTASSDPDGDSLTFAWTQMAGPVVTLTGANSGAAAFASPQVTANTPLAFQLTVSDGALSATDQVNVTVHNNVNEPPVADAGSDQTVDEQVSVALNGAGSSDPNGDALTYAWAQTAGPAVTLTGATTATPQFPSPTVTQATLLTFQLTLNDGKGGTATGSVNVTVSNNVNEPPVARAGADQSVASGSLVTLNGSGSTDPNGDSLTFAWTQTVGSPVSLTGAVTVQPTFIAPSVTANTLLTFQLTVSDGKGETASDTVNVTVTPEQVIVGEGLRLSKNADFSTEDSAFNFGETMYILVWSDQLDSDNVKEARWQLEGAEQSLSNNFDGTYTAQVVIDDNVKQLSLGEVVQSALQIQMEDQSTYQLEFEVEVTLVGPASTGTSSSD